MRRLAIATALAACGAPASQETPSNASAGTSHGRSVVVLVAPRERGNLERPGVLRFVPMACTIDGRIAIGVACSTVMPSSAQIWTPMGVVATTRAASAPACCNYNACAADTVPYVGSVRDANEHAIPRREDMMPIVGVWPPDASHELDFAGQNSRIPPPRRAPGPRSYELLGSSDLDHDGKLERIVYERWANDFGFDVVDASGSAAYSVSCGNI